MYHRHGENSPKVAYWLLQSLLFFLNSPASTSIKLLPQAIFQKKKETYFPPRISLSD